MMEGDGEHTIIVSGIDRALLDAIRDAYDSVIVAGAHSILKPRIADVPVKKMIKVGQVPKKSRGVILGLDLKRTIQI